MQLGIFTALIIAKKFACPKDKNINVLFKPRWTAISTAMGITTRVAVMSVILLFALPQKPPIGFSFTLAAAIGYLPLAAIFNASIALYTIIIALVISQRVQNVLHLALPQEIKCTPETVIKKV